MCGIAGLLSSAPQAAAELEALAGRMGGQLLHRGPDSGAAWWDAGAGVALAHRRLAILDLSPEGAQPMHSESGRLVVTFNGEIYNHGELRIELEKLGHRFRGHSDTEVLLAAAEAWGVPAALRRFNGMFAFALWDRRERLLHLARDRMGEKPLYYGWFGGTFLFGSEIKALRAHPAFRPVVDRGALALYMRHGYVPAPHAIFQGLRKLEPAASLTVSLERPGRVGQDRYWSHAAAAAQGLERPFQGTAADAVAALVPLLREAVRLRLQSDVPLGAFLSGGIDSSTVVALMQAQSAQPVKTFTIGFGEAGFDEAGHAKAVACHLGTDHTELYLSAADALEVIPRLPRLYDEPFADPSQIPTFLVSQLARRRVTVSLSGDGGDELFAGYARYGFSGAVRRGIRRVPAWLRRPLGRAVRAVPEAVWSAALRPFRAALPQLLRGDDRGERVLAVGDVLQLPPDDALLYRRLVSDWKDPTLLVLGSSEPPTAFTDPAACPRLATFEDRMMFLDAVAYLPDDILVKVDRASMGVSLEARVPLLDHRLVELAWRLPLELKRREGGTKWILRQILHQHVPRELVERPKQGFDVPTGAWLRGPLREWAQDLLSPERLRRDGYLDEGAVQRLLSEHLSGRRDRRHQLWDVLMFQAWLSSEAGPGPSGAGHAPGA